DRIDVAVARRHGDLRARAGFASRALDPDDLLVDLGDLLLEQLLEQALVRAGQDDLRTARVAIDVEAVRLDRIADAIALARHLLAHRQHGLGLADVDDERAALEAAHDAADDLALAVLELVVDVVALGLADALIDELLRRLRGDAAELLARVLEVDQVAELLVLLARALLVLGAIEDLEQELVAELGLEASGARLLDGDLATFDRVL